MSVAIPIGRLLRAGVTGFEVGCRVSQLDDPSFGALVTAPISGEYTIYGLIYDIHIDDDGLVRQLVTADGVDDDIINDNRLNRNVPLELSVLSVGYQQGERIYHLLPPRPPLSLEMICLCTDDEICRFTTTGRFGYFRHLMRSPDLPLGELLAAHLQQAHSCHTAAGNPTWLEAATQELITLLRDDYPRLMETLGALQEVYG